MKAADVIVGVEYDETGPLAYGVEPRTHHTLVRFTEAPRPGWGFLYTWRAEDDEQTRNGETKTVTRWKRHDTVMVNINDLPAEQRHLPQNQYSMGREPEGTLRQTFMPSKGYYVGEKMGDNGWRQGLIQPAGIHRTWAEHLAQEEARRRQRRERDIGMAPSSYAQAIREVVKWARLLGEDITPGTISDDIFKEWERNP